MPRWPSKTEAERFLEKVDQTGDCWEWTAFKNSCGYGMFRTSTDGVRIASRVAYRLFVGEISDGAWILHSCDNPPCVNPDHLRAGSQQDNTDDMVSRGRWSSGNVGKTRCKNGHLYTDANTYMNKGWRSCKTCRVAALSRHQQKKKS